MNGVVVGGPSYYPLMRQLIKFTHYPSLSLETHRCRERKKVLASHTHTQITYEKVASTLSHNFVDKKVHCALTDDGCLQFLTDSSKATGWS